MKVADGVFSYVWKGYFVNNANMFYFGEPLNILFDPGLKNYMDTRFGEMKSDGINPDIRFRSTACTEESPRSRIRPQEEQYND